MVPLYEVFTDRSFKLPVNIPMELKASFIQDGKRFNLTTTMVISDEYGNLRAAYPAVDASNGKSLYIIEVFE